jgi:predicted DNA repair protein MutK
VALAKRGARGGPQLSTRGQAAKLYNSTSRGLRQHGIRAARLLDMVVALGLSNCRIGAVAVVIRHDAARRAGPEQSIAARKSFVRWLVSAHPAAMKYLHGLITCDTFTANSRLVLF